MASGAIVWFRVELGSDGKATDIRAVDHPEKDGVQVFYVKARNQKEAAHAVHNAYCAARTRRNRAEWKKAGRCTKCGRERDVVGSLRCSHCGLSKQQENARALRRKHGEKVPVPSRREGLDRFREAELEDFRRDLLGDVLRWYYGKGDFLKRLKTEFFKAGGKEEEAA